MVDYIQQGVKVTADVMQSTQKKVTTVAQGAHSVSEALSNAGLGEAGDLVKKVAKFLDKVPDFIEKGKKGLQEFTKKYETIKPILEKMGSIVVKAFKKLIEGVKNFISTAKDKGLKHACQEVGKAIVSFAKSQGVDTDKGIARA